MDEAFARALRILVERTSGVTGALFFEALASAAHAALDADRVFVAKIDHDGADLVTLACWPPTATAPRTMLGTPLEEVARHGEPIARSSEDTEWPGMRSSFVALPVRGSDERTLGLVVAMGTALDLPRAHGVLAPFALRVAAELERISDDDTRRASDARAFERQRLERVASLAGGIAHDFNNVLVGILGNVELALLRVGDDPRIRSHLEAIQRASLRAADLTRQLLTYAGKTHYEVQPLRMDEVLRELEGLFAASTHEHATIEYAIEEALPSVLADRGKISQLFVALVANAAEAIGEGSGTIRVSAKKATFDDTSYRPEPPDPSRRYLEITVADDGPGMSAETRARLFEPFFSTKAASGRGLGLPASLGIVLAHDGRIAIESVENEGTTVRVLLPTAESKPPPRPEGRALRPTPVPKARGAGSSMLPSRPEDAGPRRFLVVDDDSAVRDIARAILEGGGFDVDVAQDGAAAIAAFDILRASLAGLVLDLRMPRIRGVEVLRHVRRTNPTLPVVVITAYPDELESLPKDEYLRVVAKPFVASELLDAVQALRRRT